MLPPKNRLKKRKEISDLFRFGKTFSSEILLMKISDRGKDEPSQFGFGASLKFSKKAVERNKAKRWMKEAVRAKIQEIQLGHKVIFLINPTFPKEKLSYELIREDIENLLKKAKILR